MKKRVLGLLLSTVVLAGVLAGCGGQQQQQAPAATEEAAEEEAPAEEAATEEAAAPADGVQVGIVLPTKDEPRWLQDQAQFENILGDAGFTNQVLFSQGSSATEATNVET